MSGANDFKRINGGGSGEIGEFVSKARKIAHTMAAVYNQKKNAYEAATTTYNKKGTLDIGRIHSYRTSDDIFKRNKVINGGGSHALVCALDFSVSMRGILGSVARQFLINALFCKYAKIEFQFFTYSTCSSYNKKPKNAFLLAGNNYARYVDIGNSTMSEGQLIDSFYDIMLFYISQSATPSSGINVPKDIKVRIHDKFNSMGSTPLIPALYQSYLLAKTYQERGIQNVSILVINDGDNNCELKSNGKISSITDPFTKRVYPTLAGSRGDSLICVINRMARDHGINVLNIFLGNIATNGVESSLKSIINEYVSIHDGKKVHVDEKDLKQARDDMISNHMVQFDNLCYYNKVIIVDTAIFPVTQLERTIERNAQYRYKDIKPAQDRYDNMTEKLISLHGKETKNMTVLGRIISNFLVTDFKIY